MTAVTYRTADVDGFEVFYREAGDASKPTLLLLCRVLDFNATPQKTPALRAARFRRSMAAVFAGCGGNSGTLSGWRLAPSAGILEGGRLSLLSFLILPTFDLVMIAVMIESTGLFLALSDITGRKIEQRGPRREPVHRRPGHAGRRAVQHLPVHPLLAEHGLGQRHPLLGSGILLTAVATVLLNRFFSGARGAIEAAKTAEAHCE